MEYVLVTGAAGFIGSHLVERLLEGGQPVVGVDNFDDFYPPAEKRANLSRAVRSSRFRLIEGDCADLEGLDAALGRDEIAAVVHLAARPGVRPSIADPVGYVGANVAATAAMLELALRRGVRRFVFGSSSSVYGNSDREAFAESDCADRPISPYAATKLAAEALCHVYHALYGASIFCLRFFTVYGPRQRPDLAIRKFTTRILRDEPVTMFGDGSAARDYTWIGDILDGIMAAIDRTATGPAEFEIINLGGSRTTTVQRLIELIGEAVGTLPRVVQAEPQPGDVRRTCADISKAERLLGYHPLTPVEEGIPRFVEWLRHESARWRKPAGRPALSYPR